MLCEKCGFSLNENSRVCPQCGSPTRGEEQHITSTTTHNGPLGSPTPVLVWGILGLSFALTFYLCFLGIIFSCVGLKKARGYNRFTNYAPSTQAKIGRRLSIAGVITGSVLTVLLILLIVAIVFYGLREGSVRRISALGSL